MPLTLVQPCPRALGCARRWEWFEPATPPSALEIESVPVFGAQTDVHVRLGQTRKAEAVPGHRVRKVEAAPLAAEVSVRFPMTNTEWSTKNLHENWY